MVSSSKAISRKATFANDFSLGFFLFSKLFSKMIIFSRGNVYFSIKNLLWGTLKKSTNSSREIRRYFIENETLIKVHFDEKPFC